MAVINKINETCKFNEIWVFGVIGRGSNPFPKTTYLYALE